MKRFFVILLAFSLVLSLAGCTPVDFIGELFNRTEPAEPIWIPDEAPATVDPALDETSEPTEAVVPIVLVSDQFMDTVTVEEYNGPATYCYHIPQFELDTEAATALNQTIYDEIYPLMERYVYANPDYPFVFGISYDWVQVENIVSLLVRAQCDTGMTYYYAYHIYADGSATVKDEQIWEYYGYDGIAFYDLVAGKLKEKYISKYAAYPGADIDSYYQMQLANTVSYENVRSVKLFISAQGDLCCYADIYSLAGADCYTELVNLTGAETPLAPVCEENHE